LLGAFSAKIPDLSLILETWPDLPGAVQAGIVAIARAALPDKK